MEIENEVVEGEVVENAPKKENKKPANIIRINRISTLVSSLYLLVSIIVYVVLGLVFGGSAWSTAWVLFLGIIVVPTIVEAIMRKNWLLFNFPIFILMIYLTLGLVGNVFNINLWHPYWVIFFFIPIFYTLFGLIDANKKNK